MIEITEFDKSITKRITPFYKIISVHSTYKGAHNALLRQKRKYESSNIPCSINENFLVISSVPWRAFTNISYKIEQATLYGINLQKYVFHLMGFEGYIKDQDKPYQYTNLGWFTSPYIAKATKEWQILKYILLNRTDVSGYETEFEIGIYGPYGITDQNPYLTIRPYKLLK